jgi:hypothetical protein
MKLFSLAALALATGREYTDTLVTSATLRIELKHPILSQIVCWPFPSRQSTIHPIVSMFAILLISTPLPKSCKCVPNWDSSSNKAREAQDLVTQTGLDRATQADLDPAHPCPMASARIAVAAGLPGRQGRQATTAAPSNTPLVKKNSESNNTARPNYPSR